MAEVSTGVQIAALAAPVITGLGAAVVGVVGQYGIARDKRRQDRLADVYLDLADYVFRVRQQTLALGNPAHEPPEFDEAEKWPMLARVHAYASPNVRRVFEDELLPVRVGFLIALQDSDHDRILPGVRAVVEVADRLLDMIHDELAVHPRRRRWRPALLVSVLATSVIANVWLLLGR